MSDVTSTEIPIPDPSQAIVTPPPAAKRGSNRDTILFATTALAVIAVTGGVIMRHKIEPLIAPLVGRLMPHSAVHPDAKAHSIPSVPTVKPPAKPVRVASVQVSPPTPPHDIAGSTHPALPASISGLLALRPDATDVHKLPAVMPSNTSTGPKSAPSGPIGIPKPSSATSLGETKPSAARTTPSPSVQPPEALSASGATGSSHSRAPSISGPDPALHHAPVLPAVNALLHPDVLAAHPAVKLPPPSPFGPATPTIMPDADKTLVPIAHPVQVARKLVAGPMTPQSEIPVLSLVSQLGVLVAQLRNQNLLLMQQVATMQATMDRRLNSFGRTLNLEEAKGALALALHPAEAPRAVVRPHIFQPKSDVPVGKIPVTSYRVIGAGPGYAVLSHDGDAVAASVGGAVPGVGRVLAIHQQGTSWVVETTHGVIH